VAVRHHASGDEDDHRSEDQQPLLDGRAYDAR
jgi:hypothetical protein